MWIVALFIFLMASLQILFSFALIEKKKYILGASLGIGLLTAFMQPFAIELNIQHLVKLLTDLHALKDICTLQIFEALTGIILTVLFAAKTTGRTNAWFYRGAVLLYLPQAVFFAGLFSLQVFWLGSLERISFTTASFLFSTATVLLLGGGTLLFRWLFSETVVILEMKMLLFFFQILIAMFFPVILTGASVGIKGYGIDVVATVGTLCVFTVLVLTGIIKNKLQSKKLNRL